MKLIFLGTGTAGAKLCPEAEMEAGRRRCTSLMIDGTILFDVALQSYDYAVKLGLDVSRITDVFVSHTHRDHYMKEALLSYAKSSRTKINLHCHVSSVHALNITDEEKELVNVCPHELFDTVEYGGARVTVLPANHMVGNDCPVHYIFEKDGKSLFYGLDGAWFCARTWEYMRKDIHLDAAILDSTVGDEPGNFRIGTHNTVPMLRLLITALAENGITNESSKIIASHIMGRDDDQEKIRLLEDLGMIVMHDGMEITV